MVNQRSKKRKSVTQQLIDESRYAHRKLIFNGREVRFESEQDLESYLDDQFQDVFPGLNLLARQYTISNQRCDLLCYKKTNRQAVIIELKNELDRYIVPQLIRYRKALLQQQPFSDLIDYLLPIELIAITPKFHEDNYTDKEACKFAENIHFLEFDLKHENGLGKFHILGQVHDMSFPITGLNELDSGTPPYHYTLSPEIGLFRSNLSFKNNFSQQINDDFIKVHSLFMRQPKIKYWVTGSSRILYSTGKGANSKKLAEITNTSRGLYLYLWLPSHVKTNVKLPMARFGFVCEKNCSPFARESTVKWVVNTKETINLKEEPGRDIRSSFTMHGMTKWTKARSYLGAAGSENALSLLIDLIKEFELLDIGEDPEWWGKFEYNTPSNLGWYIDLAIGAWNYILK